MAQRTSREQREARRRSRAYAVRQAVFADRGRRRRRDDLVAAIVFVVLVGLAAGAQVTYFTAGPGGPKPTPSASASASASAPPSASPTPSPTSTRTLPPKSLSDDRTWHGSMTIAKAHLTFTLDGRKAPQAVANFVALARSGFYEDTPCHRLTTAASGLSVLQCGDPTGTGTGGPGYTFGPLEDVPKDGVYDTGVIAMARGTAEDSQGSQFFIVYGRSTLPSPGYTVFGHVTAGLPALTSSVISKGVEGGGSDGTPAVPAILSAVTVR